MTPFFLSYIYIFFYITLYKTRESHSQQGFQCYLSTKSKHYNITQSQQGTQDLTKNSKNKKPRNPRVSVLCKFFYIFLFFPLDL